MIRNGGATLNRYAPTSTYEIVGKLRRFDERDTVFARERLASGSPEEHAYHAMHPELVEIDRRLASYIDTVNRPEQSISRKDAALSRGTFNPIVGLALPDVADGEVSSKRLESDPVEMTARIKAVSLYLGADDVRIGPLNPAWVYSHRGTPPFFANYQPNPPHLSGLPAGYRDLGWGDPIEITHRYAISMAFAQDRGLLRTGGTSFSDFEIGRVYASSALITTQLAAYIRALGWPARAHHLRNYGVLAVPVAVDAGLGELGRCGYLLHPLLGANLRLTCVTTDLPLALDPPVDLGIQDFCAKCVKCAINCPPRAIPEGGKVAVRGVSRWQIDPVKCLLYWGHLGAACTICQVVCPWSKPPTVFHRAVAQIASHVPPARRPLVWGDDLVYGRRFRPVPPPAWTR